MSDPRILVVRFSAIGDCIMTAWAVSDLRTTYPDAHIVWAVESRCVGAIDTKFLASEIAVIKRDEWEKQPIIGIWRHIRAFATLRKHNFDIGIDFQGHAKTAFCLKLAAPKRRLGVRGRDIIARALTRTLPDQPEGTHIIDWNSAAIRTLGPIKVSDGPIMPDPIALPFQRTGKPLATITIGAGHPTKEYSRSSWLKIGEGLVARGYQVVFLGGPDERPMIVGDPFINMVGRATMIQTLSMVAKSEIHVASDTGTGHAAAAYGVPVVSIFGPTKAATYRPYTKKGIVLQHGDSPNLVTPGDALAAVDKLSKGIG